MLFSIPQSAIEWGAESGSPASSPDIDKPGQTGDPGRTPGKAEGDEETVDESLADKENKPLH